MEVDESVQRLLAGGEPLDVDREGAEDGEEGLAKRPRNEEFDEEDEDGGQPLVAADDVATNLKVWARTLQRPPKGNLKTYSEGLWRPDKQLCRIIKTRGNDLRSMGFPYEGDTHLYPEETLFLVERCKLEVGNLTTPELYEAVELYHYLTYAYFRQTSLIVFRADPTCPVGVAFEAHAPSSHFKKTAQNDPIFYVMYGGTRAPVPTDEEMVRIFEWAGKVPVKYAMVSDEGGVFAVNMVHRPLENHTHLATVAAAAAAAAAGGVASKRAQTPVGSGRKGEGEGEQQQQQQQGGDRGGEGGVNGSGRRMSRKQRREEERAQQQQQQQQQQDQEGAQVVHRMDDEEDREEQQAEVEAPASAPPPPPAAEGATEDDGRDPMNGEVEHAPPIEHGETAAAATAGAVAAVAMDEVVVVEANGDAHAQADSGGADLGEERQ